MKRLVLKTFVALQIALFSGTAIASKRALKEDAPADHARALVPSHRGQTWQERAASSPIYILPNDPRSKICKYLDGVTAKRLLFVSKTFYDFIHDAIMARGHVKLRYCPLWKDYIITSHGFWRAREIDTLEPYGPFGIQREPFIELLQTAIYDSLKGFIDRETTVTQKATPQALVYQAQVNNPPSDRILSLKKSAGKKKLKKKWRSSSAPSRKLLTLQPEGKNSQLAPLQENTSLITVKKSKWRSVDISMMGTLRNEILQNIVRAHPQLKSIVFNDELDIEYDNISAATMKVIGDSCKSIESLRFRLNIGTFKDVLFLNKPVDAFNELKNLEIYYSWMNERDGSNDPPVFLFKHILCAFPKLQNLVIHQVSNLEFGTYSETVTSPLRHLTLQLDPDDPIANNNLLENLLVLARCCPLLQTLNMHESSFMPLSNVARLFFGIPSLRELDLPNVEGVYGRDKPMKLIRSNDDFKEFKLVFNDVSASYLKMDFFRAYSASFYGVKELNITIALDLSNQELLEFPTLFPHVETLYLPRALYSNPSLYEVLFGFKKIKTIIAQ